MTPKAGMYIGVGASVGLLILIAAIVLLVKFHGESVGEPTEATLAPGVLDKMELDLDLSKLVRLPPASGSGAEGDYQVAVKVVAGMGEGFLDKLKETPEPEKDATFKGLLDRLEAAADKGLEGDLDFEAAMPLSPGTEWPTSDALRGLGTLACKSGMSMRSEKDRAGSEKALRAAIIWGDRLFHRGTYLAYKSAGLGCISEGLAQYERHYSKDFYAEPAAAAVAKSLYDIYLPVAKRWAEKEKIVRRVHPVADPGDLWNLAEHDKDRAWRAEGLMWLGVAKWTEATGSQRAAIDKYLGQKAAAADPVIAGRARAAAEFSRVDVRGIVPE